ncbi:HAD-IC family P-type ATPase [Micromonospora sp. R77]|uniref:HAD-IC family P-type ATPase n=1 Tax=Micromonospora sp. R77 TaxID=2925836 RepID=UPI001F6007FE|nr:HAD-IC family P-type ATPase [Micromonospora sp. R77]MCI4065504.1 HAD-IC family P-type ATPase [Micromonospora sp. R77]
MGTVGTTIGRPGDTADRVVEVPATGLSTATAQARLRTEGPNQVAAPPRRHLAVRVLHQLTDPLVALLLAAAVVTTVLGDHPDTAVILLVVAVNTAIGVVQELRADRAIAALDQLAAPTARVVRDGQDVILPAAEVVRDDLVRVEAGDVVPADLLLTEANRLRLDESALTGEAVPVAGDAGEELSAGTVVAIGRGTGVVLRTGPASALGRISGLVAGTRPGPTPLQRRLAGLGRVLGLAAVLLSGLVFVVGVAGGRPVVQMAVTAVSLVVAAVPESLPAVVTLALALGARRMARSRAIPRRLHAVETLGSVTVIASDKTGTLTQGRMAVQRAVTVDGAGYTVTGTGYAPEGVVRQRGERVVVPDELRRLARAGLLCNDAALAPPDDRRPEWTAVGDPLEAALVAFAARCGLDPDATRAAWPRVAEHPVRPGHPTDDHGAPRLRPGLAGGLQGRAGERAGRTAGRRARRGTGGADRAGALAGGGRAAGARRGRWAGGHRTRPGRAGGAAPGGPGRGGRPAARRGRRARRQLRPGRRTPAPGHR